MASPHKRVLLVDDEPGVADLAAEYLERIADDMSVRTATAAPDGLELVGDEEFDCVVSDYNMPEMNGLEFLEAVRDGYPSLPFILYTGKGSEEIASEAISAGVTEYLQKETGTDHYEVLANRIENAISENRARVELRETGNKIEALHDTAARAATCTDRTPLCQLAVAAAEEILAFDICDLSLCENSQLVPKAVSKGVPTDGYYRSTPVDADDSLAAKAYLAGETIRIDDLRSHGVAPAESDYRSALTVPLDDHGVFQAVSRDVNGFDDRDRELAELLLAHVSAALDRIESEEQLRSERDRFAALFRNIPHAIGVGKFEEDAPVIRDANPTFEEVFGWSIDELSGESIDDFIIPDDERAAAEAERINNRMREGDHVSAEEVRRITADGPRDFLLHTVRAPSDDTDGFVIYTDITEQKRRERELQRQNERLDEFGSVLSHDLRNPLEVADGNARLLAEECDHDSITAIRNALARIDERVEEALELAEQGRTVREPSAVSVPTVVEEAWTMVETGEATLRTRDLPGEVAGDRSRLRRLFENLFRNSVEHGSGTAEPDPETESGPDSGDSATSISVTVGSLDRGGVYVEDDGEGVEGDHERLFERGFTTREEGTGLGLRIVEDIAHAHGWSVRAADGDEGGLRIEIEFRSVDA
ncbi:response regulator [Halorussus salilacus]|uniref:hybrid sensor histidine kinase/response regulator n=1 Tax=Halorussus salilacus TaxID=2953750 RepID=UPI00209C78DE|nr:response regulator [Halorussus salilacus]USZ67078.1 response regulator [Halorussus salilacus]